MSRILLIEDDHSLRRALRLALEKSGYEVVEAAEGREGLATLKLQPVDLVVTDIIMPGMEGIETITALRKLNPQLKIIAISGGGRSSADDYLRMALQFGAAQVFAKPFEIGTLCSAIAELLGNPGTEPPSSPA
jgi:DNA-binding response OmpR family regulator